MKLSTGWKILAASLILMSLAPASAAAKRGYFAIGPSSNMQASLRGSNGYMITLSANGGFVTLSVHGHHATVQYLAQGAAGKGKIKASFGGLGRVALRFRPRGKAHLRKEPAGNCRGGDSLIQPGAFVGKLDFEGEQDYTRVKARRIKGTVIHTKRQVCKNSGSEKDEGMSPGSLGLTLVNAADNEGGSSFNAFKIDSKSGPGRSLTSFGAMVLESPRPGFSIIRSIQVTAEDASAFNAVTSHGRVDEATVTPPAPFSGSATYRRAVAKNSETWVGSLAGDFPGLGTVSLAGPEFCAEGVTLKGCNGAAAWVVAIFRQSAR
jgi:hypothetical protein